jgi:hypothetical protein
LDGRITNRSVSEQDLTAMGRRRVALNDEIKTRKLLKPGSTNHPARKPAYGQR